jgi:NAD(P)-dependent dehydrogenase (short-subunit alcohol dehydrogenase family)
MNWSKRNWLITGASAGLGLALTEAVVARGGKVIATARDPSGLQELAAASGGRVRAERLDVTDPAAIARVVRDAEGFGGVDVVVNNAGYGFLGGVEESSDDEIRAMFEVNFFGAAALMRAVLPGMRARKGGYVINISSIAGAFGGPAGGYYSATKFGLEGLSEALAREGAPLGIEVLIVEPGAFRTAFFGRSMVLPKRRIEDYALVAATHAYAAANDGAQPGDPVRAAEIILDTVDGPAPPRRLILGEEAYAVVHGSLQSRLDEVEAQKELALSACFPK